MGKAGDGHAGAAAGAANDLKVGVRRRLEFIEFRLFWDGRVNRRDLMAAFRISPQQASNDLELYERTAPGNAAYDRVAKSFLRGPLFQPVLAPGVGERHLVALQLALLNRLPFDQTWFSKRPTAEAVTLRHKPTDDGVLRAILDAIRDKLELRVSYRSMTGSPPGDRLISPHSIAFADGRWHARAYNRDHGHYRDYNLNRIVAVEEAGAAPHGPEHDHEWNMRVDVVLVPNPLLSADKQAAVRQEYPFEGDQLVVQTRLALFFYLAQERSLLASPEQVEPDRQQLVLENRKEIETLQAAARQMTTAALRTAAQR